MVGANTADDAGVFLLREDLALIQTLDFFTPIVNDPYLFGQIAAANALSDVYAMGGVPLTAMNICCFPVNDMPKDVFRDILRGGQDKVKEAGAALAGGHSIEDTDVKYGLSVTGIVHPDKVVTNAGLKPGQKLVLTKPLGSGVITTAHKGGLAPEGSMEQAVEYMRTLNKLGGEVMQAVGATGGTDVTGFGLLGHGLELARASRVGMVIHAVEVPLMDGALDMASIGLVPAGSHRNKNFCAKELILSGPDNPVLVDLLADTQTSGGLLFGVEPERLDQALELLAQGGGRGWPVGEVTAENPGLMVLEL